MFVHFCLGLLALFSLTASQPACDPPITYGDDVSQFAGRWILHSSTSSNLDFLEEHKKLTSSWMTVSPVPDSTNFELKWHDKISGTCHHEKVISSYSTSSGHLKFQFSSSDGVHEGKHVKTCPDCLLWIDDTIASLHPGENITGRNAFLFTKSGSLDDNELANIKKQIACEGIQTELNHVSSSDLCPDTEQ